MIAAGTHTGRGAGRNVGIVWEKCYLYRVLRSGCNGRTLIMRLLSKRFFILAWIVAVALAMVSGVFLRLIL